MAWVLTRGLTTWRNEINTVFPGRDKTTDGSVGNLAHQAGISGHNPDRTGRPEYADGDTRDEVRAIDVDKDLVPGSGVDWMARVVQFVVEKARRGEYVPFRYVIYKPAGGRSTIWHRSYGWAARAYTGANAHSEHAHFSGDYSEKADEWTGSLGLAAIRAGSSGEGIDELLIKQGDSGEAVRFWQYLLNRLEGAELKIDGDYGPVVAAAVNAYRKKYADAGPATLVTGWMLYHALGRYAGQFAGVNGRDGERGPQGLQGVPGRDGKDGTAIGGNLTVTGGSLRVVASGQEG